MATWQQNAARWQEFYPSAELQAEFFLLKFAKDGLTRKAVFDLKDEFSKYDLRGQGELEEQQALQILEHRHETRTFVELRQMMKDIDLDQNHKLSFLEWACAILNKSWQQLHSPSVDPEEIARAEALKAQAAQALEDARKNMEAWKEKEAVALAEKEAKEREAAEALANKQQHEEEVARKRAADEEKKRAEEEERKAKTSESGVKGAAAKFHYAAKDTADTTMDNATRIKAEAAARKEAKRLEEEKKKADAEEAKAREEAERVAAEKAKADAEAELVAAQAKLTIEQAEKASEGKEASERERKAYEEAKAQAEAEAKAKEEEEKRKRDESRARLKEKASLWK